jgi:hypothetical protein
MPSQPPGIVDRVAEPPQAQQYCRCSSLIRTALEKLTFSTTAPVKVPVL